MRSGFLQVTRASILRGTPSALRSLRFTLVQVGHTLSIVCIHSDVLAELLAEVFMTQDKSPDFVETERFVDRRLEDVRIVGTSAANVAQWVNFTGHAFTNVLRSKGVRI